MFIRKYKSEWWFEPYIRKPRFRVSARLAALDPTDPQNTMNLAPRSRIAAFKHSRLWVRYNRLQSIDTGYITPLYDLNAIGQRYWLSEAGKRYFRNHILPEPFDIVRRRSVHAHHWSRFTLVVLDTVMLDLEKRGFNQFLSKFEDHVELVHRGVHYLEERYKDIAEHRMVESTDKYGVQWLE